MQGPGWKPGDSRVCVLRPTSTRNGVASMCQAGMCRCEPLPAGKLQYTRPQSSPLDPVMCLLFLCAPPPHMHAQVDVLPLPDGSKATAVNYFRENTQWLQSPVSPLPPTQMP